MSNINDLEDEIKITLISQDTDVKGNPIKFEIEREYTNVSSTITNALTSKGESTVPVKIDSKCLKHVIDYMKLKKGEEKMKKIPDTLYKSLEETFSPEDLDFIKEISKDKQILFNMALAANWLGMNYLLELTCAAIAFQAKQRKTPAMVKKYFDLNESTEGGSSREKQIVDIEMIDE